MSAYDTTPIASRQARPLEIGAWFLLALAALLTVSLLWHTTGDLDLPLHDRVGQDILSGRGFPTTNTYSFTATQHPWTNHEWAFQAIVAFAGNLTGADDLATRDVGWRIVRLILGLGVLGAIAWDLCRSQRLAAASWLGPVAVLALGLLWTRLTLRPELLSLGLFVVLIGRIEAALSSTPRGPLWRTLVDPRQPAGQAFLLVLVWHQFHGFAALAAPLWLLGGLLVRSDTPASVRWRVTLGACGFAVLASLITPNGWHGLVYPLQVMAQFGGDRPDLRGIISELVPLLDTRGSLATTIVLYQLSLVWGIVWVVLTAPSRSWLRVAIWLLAAFAAWQGQRHLGIYAVAFALLHGGPIRPGPTLGTALTAILPPPLRRPGETLVRPTVLVAALLALGFWLSLVPSNRWYLQEGVARRFGTGLTPAVFPVAQADALADNHRKRVANTVDAASTLVARRVGAVAIDGRTEAYPPAAWREYVGFRSGGYTALRQLQSWHADAVCLAHRNTAAHALVRTLLESPEWDLTGADAAGIRFEITADETSNRVGRLAILDDAIEFRKSLSSASPARDVRQADMATSWAGLLQLMGNVSLAEEVMLAGLARCEDHPTLLHNYGNLLLARGDYRSALRRFEAAAAANRNAAPPLVNAGTCLFRLGRLVDAGLAFSDATRRDPANFEAWANLAEIRRQLGNRDEAGAAYRRALEIRPGDVRLRDRAQSL